MTITIPRSTLIVAGMYCFLAGLCLANAVAAWDTGASPLGSASAAVIAASLAVHFVRAAARKQPIGPIPKAARRPPQP